MTLVRRFATALLGLLLLGGAYAGTAFRVETRPGIVTPVFWHETPGAGATVLVLTGGAGGFGRVVDGLPASGNFLTRSAQHWIDQGFHYAAFGRPTDMDDLDGARRVSAEHLADLQATVAWLRQRTATPIWVVGTSRGTISAAHLAVNWQDPPLAGVVLTASVTHAKAGALPSQALERIRLPVLLVHHEQDSCELCRPQALPQLLPRFSQAPVKRLVMVRGGGEPLGPPCEAQHHHGFVGQEADVVRTIGDWIRHPTPN